MNITEEETKAVRKKYYEEHREALHREEILNKCKEYRAKNKEKNLLRSRRYREAHREELKRQKKEYIDEHWEEVREKERQYYQQNKERISAMRNENNKRRNEESKLTATNRRKQWTTEEIETVIRMKREAHTDKDIALCLGRTISSISTICRKLRDEGNPYTGEAIDI